MVQDLGMFEAVMDGQTASNTETACKIWTELEVNKLINENKKLKRVNNLLTECVDYYAADTSWVPDGTIIHWTGTTCTSDLSKLKGHCMELEGFENISYGGKRARWTQFLIQGIENE